MCSVIAANLIVLLPLFTHALAKQNRTDDAQDFVDQVVDRLASKLIDKLFDHGLTASRLHHTGMAAPNPGQLIRPRFTSHLPSLFRPQQFTPTQARNFWQSTQPARVGQLHAVEESKVPTEALEIAEDAQSEPSSIRNEFFDDVKNVEDVKYAQDIEDGDEPRLRSEGPKYGNVEGIHLGDHKAEGYIRLWKPAQGYGFVDSSDGGETLFCHFSQLLGGVPADKVKEGDMVKYVKKFNKIKKDWHATKLRLVTGRGLVVSEDALRGFGYIDADDPEEIKPYSGLYFEFPKDETVNDRWKRIKKWARPTTPRRLRNKILVNGRWEDIPEKDPERYQEVTYVRQHMADYKLAFRYEGRLPARVYEGVHPLDMGLNPMKNYNTPPPSLSKDSQ